MDFNDYFDPVSLERPSYQLLEQAFVNQLWVHTANNPIKPGFYELVLIGVPEDSMSINQGSSGAPDEIRKKLYQLSAFSRSIKIADFGNLKKGKTINDTYYALRDVCSGLVEKGSLPLVIGGSQDLTYGLYQALKNFHKPLGFSTIDSRLDFRKNGEDFDDYTYLKKIFDETNEDHTLDYCNMGHQSYFVSSDQLKYMKDQFYQAFRLGNVRYAMSEFEPVLRDAHLLSIDISAVKQSDAPAHILPSPNGFAGEELCQLAKYAGLSENLSCMGIFGVNPRYDRNFQTVHLAAQALWYFIEGFLNRMKETPKKGMTNFKKFIVKPDGVNDKIVFYRSLKSNRWWMEVEMKESKQIIACSYKDYIDACNNEIPERYWKSFQKLD